MDIVELSVNREMRVQLAVPYIKRLMDVTDVGGRNAGTQRREVEAYDTEMQAVGVAAEIIARVALAAFLAKLACI